MIMQLYKVGCVPLLSSKCSWNIKRQEQSQQKLVHAITGLDGSQSWAYCKSSPISCLSISRMVYISLLAINTSEVSDFSECKQAKYIQKKMQKCQIQATYLKLFLDLEDLLECFFSDESSSKSCCGTIKMYKDNTWEKMSETDSCTVNKKNRQV